MVLVSMRQLLIQVPMCIKINNYKSNSFYYVPFAKLRQYISSVFLEDNYLE